MTKDIVNKERLADFKRVLTFQIVTKIDHHFKGNVHAFFSVPRLWMLFRDKRLPTTINPFKLRSLFNDAGLTRQQVKSIFGKYPGEKTFTLPYSEIIKTDPDISVKLHGVISNLCTENTRKFGKANTYLLPEAFIQSIFDNPELLKEVKDAGSDYYTDRQRRLIFTQLLNQKHYHYKTNRQIAEEKQADEIADEIFADLDIDAINR